METKLWLVRAASLAVVGSLTWSAFGQAPPARKAGDDEGPFAPKGKTGKLKEEEQSATAPKGEAPEAPPPPEKPYAAGLDIVYGFGSTGSGTESGSQPVDFGNASFILGGSYRVDPTINARLRLPFSSGSITDPNVPSSCQTSTSCSANALGNLELAMTYTTDMGPRTKLPLDVALVLPIAQGDRFPPPDDLARGQRFRVNTAAQAARGLEEDALFAPHRLSLVPGIGLRYRGGGFATGGFLKIPLMLRAGGEDAPPAIGSSTLTYSIKSPAIEVLVGGDIRADISRNKFDIGLRAWAVFLPSDPIEPVRAGSTPPSKIQLVLEPQIRGVFGPIKAVVGFLFPIAGRLGSDGQHANGIRLSAVYGF